MSGFYPVALEGNAVDPFKTWTEYENVLNQPVNRAFTQAQTLTEAQRPASIQAQTTGQQIQNALGVLNLQFRQQALGTAGGAFAGQGQGAEPLPGQAGSSFQGGGGGGSFAETTGQRESGGDYGSVNKQGFSGKYQMGKGALAAAGVYQPAPREDMAAQQGGEWWGTFNIPGYDHPITYQQFLQDPVAQERAFAAHTANLDREIQQRGLDRYIGQTVAGVPITQDSLRSMMHGGGPAGTQRFIESGGQYNPADANRQTIADFGRRFAPGGGANQQAGGAGEGGGYVLPTKPYQVAQAGGGIQPPPGGGGEPVSPGTGGPNALAQVNPMGTSSQGIVMPGTGVALPRQQVQLAYLSPDPSKALHEAIADRKSTLATLAGLATDARSWDQNVAQAWRMGYLTNADFQQMYGHFSPELRDQVVRANASAESQVGFQSTLVGHGLRQGPGGPEVDARLLAGGPPITWTETLDDGSTRPVSMPAAQYYARYGNVPPGYSPSGTVPFQAPPPPAQERRGTDGNWYRDQPAGGAEQPAPAGTQGAQPPPGAAGGAGQPAPVAAPGAAPPPPPGSPPPAPGAPPPAAGAGAPGGVGAPPAGSQPLTAPVTPPPAGALGAGPVTLAPQAQAELDAQKSARTKTLEAPIQTAQAASQEHAVKLASAYGDEAAKVYTNSVAAPVTMERLQALQEAADLFRPGSSGQLRGDAWKRLQDSLQTLGFKSPEWLNEKTTGYDVMNKLGSFLAANMVTAMGEKAASVFENIKQIQPGALQSTGGYQAVLSSVRMDALRMQQLGDFQEQWLGTHPNTVGMQAAFNKSHPVEVYSSWVIPHPVPTTTENGKVAVDMSKLQPGMVYRNSKGAFHVWTGVQFSPPGSEPRAMAPFQ